MKKIMLLTGAALMLASAAFAAPQDKKETKKGTPTTIKCAVMNDHKVNIKDATAKKMFADYKGKRYFFCCSGCPETFNKDKDKYAKADVGLPIPKAGKTDKKKKG